MRPRQRAGTRLGNAGVSDAPVVRNHAAIHQLESAIPGGYTPGFDGLRPRILDKAFGRCWEVNVRYIHQDVHIFLLVLFEIEYKGKKHQIKVAVSLYLLDTFIWETNWKRNTFS